ncbi:MAG: hypothetical protein WC222_06600 [Parachlamydiales bacterium]|jgi:hypothetical protein
MTSNDPNQSPEKEKPTLGEKFKKITDQSNIDSFAAYAKTHTREMSAYVLLVLGILFLFIFPVLGEALIGIVAAIFFGKELLDLFLNYNRYMAQWGLEKSIVVIGVLLAFFIKAPIIFIAAGFTLGLKHLFEAGNS